MPQVPAFALRPVIRTVVKPTLGPRIPVPLQRIVLGLLGRITVLPNGTRVSTRRLGDRSAERIDPPNADYSRAILYLHGGGYTVGGKATHLALAAHLAAVGRAPLYLLDYRLAPEHPHPAAVDDAESAYHALLDAGIAPQNIGIVGDSAGGGLALATTARIHAAGGQLPGALALISPWVDATLSTVVDDPIDPMLTIGWLRACAERYSGGADPGGPEISPLFAVDENLPPTLVHAASDEILLADIERLVDRLREVGAPVHYRRLDGVWHVIHLHAGMVTESTAAVTEVGDFLRANLGQ